LHIIFLKAKLTKKKSFFIMLLIDLQQRRDFSWPTLLTMNAFPVEYVQMSAPLKQSAKAMINILSTPIYVPIAEPVQMFAR